jgi:hypothetical protein
MVDNKKVVKKKRVVRRKKKPMNKKPKKPTTQRQNQKQNVTQKVVVNVVMPKVASKRRKKGFNPPKQVKPSMNIFLVNLHICVDLLLTLTTPCLEISTLLIKSLTLMKVGLCPLLTLKPSEVPTKRLCHILLL